MVTLLLWVHVDQAHALSARVRWLPRSNEGVAGYYVYVRPAGEPYCQEPDCNGALDGGRWDAGLPLADTDGTMTAVVRGLSDLATVGGYHFALTAYNAGGDQSALSNELPLGDVAPCVVDRCPSLEVCDFGPLANGTSCPLNSACGATGVCEAGVCRQPSSTGLWVKQFKLGLGRDGPALRATGNLWPEVPLDPTGTGLTLEIADDSGAVLYRAVVPADYMVANRRGNRFKLDPSRAVVLSGLQKLSLRRFRLGRVKVTVKATASELATALERSRLTWMLRPGDECFLAEDLSCTRRGSRSLKCW